MVIDMPKLVNLELSKIVMEESIRKMLDEEAINELCSSFKRHGLLQPVIVQPLERGLYGLLVGVRRFRAAEKAGLETIPCLVLDEPLKPDEAIEARLIENLQREDLDPLDESEAYLALKEMGYSLAAIARRLGKSRPYVSKRVRLLRLHLKLREAVRRRTLTPGHAHALLRLEPEQQLALAEEVIEKGLSEKQTREKVRGLLGKTFPWRLIPVHLSPEAFETLQRIAPDGDVKRLIQETIERLIKT